MQYYIVAMLVIIIVLLQISFVFPLFLNNNNSNRNKLNIFNEEKIDVFVSINGNNIMKQQYPPCFRQPVLFTHKNVIFAFATGRNKTGTSPSLCSDPGDGSPNYIVLKTSMDYGNTFSKLQILVAGAGNTQPDFYVVYYNNYDDSIHVVYETPLGVYDIHTKDFGIRWSKPQVLVIEFDKNIFTRVTPSVGKGISIIIPPSPTLSSSVLLLLPFICSTKKQIKVRGDQGACPQCHSCIIHPKHLNSSSSSPWVVGAVTEHNGRESQIVSYNNNDNKSTRTTTSTTINTATTTTTTTIFSTQRNMGKKPGHRLQAYSYDFGDTYINEQVSNVPEPATSNWTGIKSGLVAAAAAIASNNKDNNNKFIQPVILYQSHPNSTTKRENLVVSVSYDNGKTWKVGSIPIYQGLAGYSDMSQINSTHIGVLYENGIHGYADVISLTRFRLE